jgi:hypothetical protein
MRPTSFTDAAGDGLAIGTLSSRMAFSATDTTGATKDTRIGTVGFAVTNFTTIVAFSSHFLWLTAFSSFMAFCTTVMTCKCSTVFAIIARNTTPSSITFRGRVHIN